MSNFPILNIKVVEQRTSSAQITGSKILGIIFFLAMLLGFIANVLYTFNQVHIFSFRYTTPIDDEVLKELKTGEMRKDTFALTNIIQNLRHETVLTERGL